MHTDNDQPFIDSRAFNKANTAYVLFPSQADAMLASLQLFDDVPCHIMDLIFSIVTHPDFDSKQVTLRNSIDVIDVVEESRLKDRMAVVHDRSVGGDGRVVQAGFPHFILDEVLDIIHAERIDSIKSQFEETSHERTMYCKSTPIEEDKTLKAMTIVHRSWTTLAHKALGRILHIGRPINEMNTLLSSVRKSIFGPWTTVVAIQFYQPKIDEPDEDDLDHEPSFYAHANDGDWFENLHRILVGFTNIKCLYFKSYTTLFTRLPNLTFGTMVRRNVRLEEVTLYVMPGSEGFEFDPLIENAALLKNLRTLNIEGAWISDVVERKAKQGPGFACLNNVTIKRFFASPETDLRLLSILSGTKSHLESLRIIDAYGDRKPFEDEVVRAFTPSQCVAVFEPLRALHIDSKTTADQWFKWIGPYCSSLESLDIIDGSFGRQYFDENVARIFSPSQCTAIFAQLRSLHIDSNENADLWFKLIGPYCTSLESLSIIGGSNMRETFEEDIVRAFTPSQSVAIFGQLRSLHIDSEKSADQWFEWIGLYCLSLESLSIRDRTNLKRRAFKRNGRRASPPQSAIVFDRLRTLCIDSKAAADLWLEWIGPSFSSLQFVTLGLSVSLKHDTLNLIPTTIQSLDLSLWTEWDTNLGEITGWLEWLLNIASSKKFSMLKSFALFISKDQLRMESQYYCREDLQILRTDMQVFREEMNTICEGAGVKCYFNL